MTRIGVTGHQQLGDGRTEAWVRTAVNHVLSEHLNELVGVSNLARGADQVFAGLVLERRGRLEVILPFPEYRERSLQDEHDRRTYDRLLGRAQVDVLAREGRSDEEAYLHAGHLVVARCEVLIAIWDGAPARGLGGTADIVSYARDRGRPMVIVDPVMRKVTRTIATAPVRLMTIDSEHLDAARRIGDPLVDPIVAEHLAIHGHEALAPLVGALFCTKDLPTDHPLVRAYLEGIGDIELGDPERIARGQQLFALFGPEIFLVLGSCSLPLAFAAGNGVQAIYRARRLKDDAVRRLYDTAQMIVNVMQVGGLAHGSVGWRAARKVRLIHALMRLHVQSDRRSPWSDSWGTPINQEDLAGTLLSFSVAVLHGLKRMGAKISVAEANDYVYAWSAIGRLLGIDEALLVNTESEALVLAERIGMRQIRPTPEGRLLAEQLMAAVCTIFPLRGYANSLTHFFLKDTVFGEDVARVLGLPRPDWTKALVAVRAWQKRKLLTLLHLVPGARRRRSFLARRFVQNMIQLRRPGGDAPFDVPESLARSWRVSHRRADRCERPGDDSKLEELP